MGNKYRDHQIQGVARNLLTNEDKNFLYVLNHPNFVEKVPIIFINLSLDLKLDRSEFKIDIKADRLRKMYYNQLRKFVDEERLKLIIKKVNRSHGLWPVSIETNVSSNVGINYGLSIENE